MRSDTLLGGGVFSGKWGKTYKFYSIATDNAGNVEMPPNLADATIRVRGGDTEGDVAPRPDGLDGLVSAGDVAQIRRFVGGIDDDFLYNEFQRADTAPSTSGGDGQLSATDIVQARRYAAGIDSRGEAAGPNMPLESPRAPKFSGNTTLGADRTIQPFAISRVGNKLRVAVYMNAQGDETALGFTLNFDSAILSNPTNITPGAGASGAVLTKNTRQADQGRVGILLDKDFDDPFAAGMQQLVIIEFDVAVGASGSTNASFGDQPIIREVVNGLAQPVAATFMAAPLSLSGPTAASVTVSGRVFDSNGGLISNAVTTSSDSAGGRFSSRSNTFGNYNIVGLRAGEFYTFDTRAKGFVFEPRSSMVNQNVTGIDVTATQAP